MSFWQGFLQSLLAGALQGGASASQGGANLQGTGITAGIGAVAGILQYLLQHPFTSSPHNAVAVSGAQTVVAPIVAAATPKIGA